MPAVRLAADENGKRPSVPPMRNRTVRAKGMSRRRGSRSGVSVRVANDVAARLRDIRAVWAAIQNDPHKVVACPCNNKECVAKHQQYLADEFYFIIGDLLEGRPLKSLEFHKIDRARVLAHAEE
jgi:hypothetical protein